MPLKEESGKIFRLIKEIIQIYKFIKDFTEVTNV